MTDPIQRLSPVTERYLPLRFEDGEDYAEVFDRHGEKVALTTRPELFQELERLAVAGVAQTPAQSYDHGYAVGYEDAFKEQQLEIDSLKGAMRVLEDGYDRIKSERDAALSQDPLQVRGDK